MDASAYLKQVKAKTIYLNHLQKQSYIDYGCATTRTTGGAGSTEDLADGATFTSCEEVTCARANPCAPKPPAPVVSGSFYFSGAAAYLRVENDADFNVGSADFTVEWYQKMAVDTGTATRIFSIGSFPTAEFALTFESSKVFVWVDSYLYLLGTIGGVVGTWVHMALVRVGGNISFYLNGLAIGSAVPVPTNITNGSYPLIIGAEQPTDSPATVYYKGNITNFHFVNGVALYVADFVPPAMPLSPQPESILLMLAQSNAPTADSSGKNHDAVSVGVTWSSAT